MCDWITVWQSELAAIAVDREMHENWQEAAATWARLATAMVRDPSSSNHPPTAHDPSPGFVSPRSTGTVDAARAPAPAAASDARDAEIERLGRHVAALEARVAAVEHKLPMAPSVGGSLRRPRKRKA
jgi:hypothetical protein